MVNKFSILRQIDTEILDKKIMQYRLENGENPYLFMSDTTCEALAREYIGNCISIGNELELSKEETLKTVMGVFKGSKIYENNELEFGEVEIR